MRSAVAFVLTLVVASAAAAAWGDQTNRVVFPVVAEAPVRVASDALKPGEVFYEQVLRSAKAVRLKTDLALTYKLRSRGFGAIAPASDSPLVVKAGQTFILASYAGGEIYCTSVSDKMDDSLGRIYEIAVCLKDSDSDGTLDQVASYESYPYRLRQPYEIIAVVRGGWQTVAAQYEQLAFADIPPIRLSFQYAVVPVRSQSAILSLLAGPSMEGHLSANICWPEVLMAPTAGSGGACGLMDWFAMKDWISLDAKAKGTLSAPEMTVNWQRNPDTTLKAEVVTPIPAGAATLSAGSWMVRDGDWRAGTLLVKITPAGTP